MKKASVYVVNSLSNGGAERVVSVLSSKDNENTFVFTFCDEITYPVSDNVKIINLNKRKMGKIKKYLYLPVLLYKFNKEYKKIKRDYDIELATSHLIYSHLVCRLSKYRKEFIYVIHNPYYPFDPNKSKLFKMKIKFLYENNKIVTVSKGVEKELKERYGIKTKTISTIYNPIDFEAINEKKIEPITEKNYILFCGRFNEAKRPEFAIDLFYKEGLYKKYNLVIIGTGELEAKVKEMIKKYDIEDKVILKGFVSNPYAYMYNAKLMFNCSHFEAFPMTLIEALASNCKVVSFDIDYGPKELLIGKLSKFLVPFNDRKRMAEIIETAINQEFPNVTERLNEYKIDIIIDKYYMTYKNWR